MTTRNTESARRIIRFLCAWLAAGCTTLLCAAQSAPAPATPPPRIGFERLAGFPFTIPTPPATADRVLRQIPADIRALDGKTVVVTGFMLPVKVEAGVTTEFLLMASSQLCCFGITPAMNAWVTVTMPKGTLAKQDVPLSFRGRLRVAPHWDNGWLSSIYQLEAEALDRPAAITERPFQFPADGGRH